jgi:N-acetylglucosaminyldiphosphoundecaprenol N-acetyl-beta-D-mannosaminyltransferase
MSVSDFRRSELPLAASSPTYSVAGVRIAVASPTQAAERVVAAATRGGRFEVHLCNAYTMSLVRRDARLAAALSAADLNLADGTPVAWLGRRAGMHGPVRGADLVRDVCAEGARAGLAHYFYGGREGVAEEMVRRLSRDVPGLSLAGIEVPPYRDLSDTEVEELAGRVRASGARIVWVGVGTPRQDHLVPRLATAAEVCVVPVGAAFDFISGKIPEAPGWMRGRGVEWLCRLSSEPGRLWRRYLIGTFRFCWNVAIARRP